MHPTSIIWFNLAGEKMKIGLPLDINCGVRRSFLAQPRLIYTSPVNSAITCDYIPNNANPSTTPPTAAGTSVRSCACPTCNNWAGAKRFHTDRGARGVSRATIFSLFLPLTVPVSPHPHVQLIVRVTPCGAGLTSTSSKGKPLKYLQYATGYRVCQQPLNSLPAGTTNQACADGECVRLVGFRFFVVGGRPLWSGGGGTVSHYMRNARPAPCLPLKTKPFRTRNVPLHRLFHVDHNTHSLHREVGVPVIRRWNLPGRFRVQAVQGQPRRRQHPLV